MDKAEFRKLTDELIDATREYAEAHLAAMESEDETLDRRYLEAVARFEELDAKWRAAFKPFSGRKGTTS
jgi:hypothetical protein